MNKESSGKRGRASKRTPGKTPAVASDRIRFLLPAGIFALALLVRVIYLIQIKSSLPFFSAPIMDALYHDTWAQQIASGDWLGSEPFFRAPLYVYLLAVVYKVFGHNLFLPMLLQVVMGSLSCVLTFLVAEKLFNRTVGLISGVAASFYALFIFYDAQLLITSLVVFLDLVLIGLLVFTTKRSRSLTWLVCGMVLGLSAIARPNILVFVPFILIWMFFHFKDRLSKKNILARWAILCLGVILMVAPITLRNYVVGKDFVLIAWQGGFNFYLGNNPGATGWSATAPQIDKTWWGGYKDAIRLAEEETNRKLKPSQISDFWYRKGADFILSQPLSWLKLMVRKGALFWKGYEIGNNQNIYLHKEFSSVFDALLGKRIVYLPFGLVGPLSILGLLVCVRDWRKYLLLYLFILAYSASVIVFFVCSRYRMPVFPFLIMFGSFFIWWLFKRIQNRRLFPLVISLPLLAILLMTLNTGLEKVVRPQAATDHYALGISYQNLGKLDLAVEEYKTSLKYDPHAAPPRNNLANVYAQLGKADLAVQEYRKAIHSDPSYEKSYYNLALLYHGEENLDSAIEYYSQAIGVKERYELAHLNLGVAYYQKGLVEAATEEWLKVLDINPNNQRAKDFLKSR